MTRPKLANIITTLCLLALLAVVWAVAGCAQREYRHTTFGPTGIPIEEEHYKSNTIATDTQADSVYIEKPDGTIVEVNGVEQNNDSIKAYTPSGAFITN
jgi:hypothetical protein